VGRPDVKNYLEDLGVEGRITLKWLFEKWYGGLDWIHLAQGRDTWRAFVKAVMNLQVP
jgi:hypothetical protein